MDGFQNYYDNELKDLQNYWTGRGLGNSSWAKNSSDNLQNYWSAYWDTVNRANMKEQNDYIRLRDTGMLPEQIAQRERAEQAHKEQQAKIQAAQKERNQRQRELPYLSATQPFANPEDEYIRKLLKFLKIFGDKYGITTPGAGYGL